jgi:RNA polymerase sigma-70 factor (ECF subfamily)
MNESHVLERSVGASPNHLSSVPAFAARCPGSIGEPVANESQDAALLAAVAFTGDAAAFEEIYDRHRRAVIAAALRICRNSAVAEDIAQRTFMTLWERAGRLASKSVRLRPWLLVVARNGAIDHLRSHASFVPLTGAHADACPSSCPQDEAVTNALAADLAPALAALPPLQRAVIELHYFGGLSFQAIATQTGQPLATVKSRARLGLERLRNCLG